MLELKKGVDILSAVGDVQTIDQARKLFQDTLDAEHLARLGRIKNEQALLKIANAIAMCQPDKVFITTGSPEDMQAIRKMSIDKGEESPLALKDHSTGTP